MLHLRIRAPLARNGAVRKVMLGTATAIFPLRIGEVFTCCDIVTVAITLLAHGNHADCVPPAARLLTMHLILGRYGVCDDHQNGDFA